MDRSHAPPFDHGAALRVPPPDDQVNWRTLLLWLGDAADAVAAYGGVQVQTARGRVLARSGDWIVLSQSGELHVAKHHPGGPPLS
ncbi:hypothetical protein LRS10_21775 [Phenylobacterium sp. J426]|uniref:hypothetical protein n=1 Tax=Phenylobacterium sp. J426 TaxID=2898439 RepID=UPI002150FE8A|nr:hypothetical protein [Phenylobacterium sp. J426]MCR5876541.1 hypothetical protein [Phenylobacterium sp. J426]